jgi:cell division transport system ATP-binding protein
MIQLHQISKHYDSGQQALADVSFILKQGEMAFLTGHSGAGKSTLLKLIALIEKPSYGEIVVKGKNLSRLTKSNIPYFRRQIGLIFQNPLLLSDKSIFENVALPLVLAGYRYRDIGRRVRAALDKVGLLTKEKLSPEMLSCGEQQRVGIARAIVNRPPIILADEPTGNVDPDLSREIMYLFTQLNQIGTTILVATHDISLIEQMPYRVLTLKDGSLAVDEKGERDEE